ncbi:hypothetical protein PILCRDRAFT_818216 [Piloderma croceum F 1598]|uniref:Uncharacterized protein n=1 Tax=Piloderma croceum (strain F 1598) TaxID=765440 RepID=A0A0C3FKS7_PILCF|nr:hypothetical protein PILCRDRAFT_818216 [Piloderma croceum F 1598]
MLIPLLLISSGIDSSTLTEITVKNLLLTLSAHNLKSKAHPLSAAAHSCRLI